MANSRIGKCSRGFPLTQTPIVQIVQSKWSGDYLLSLYLSLGGMMELELKNTFPSSTSSLALWGLLLKSRRLSLDLSEDKRRFSLLGGLSCRGQKKNFSSKQANYQKKTSRNTLLCHTRRWSKEIF